MERDRLKYTIDRLDHYFESINNKTALYIALNTFILGSIIAWYSNQEKSILIYSLIFDILVLILSLLGLVTLILLVRNSLPYISKTSDSLLYFNSIKSLSKKDFINKSKKHGKSKEIKDLRKQVHLLSVGLCVKFSRIKLCGQLLIIQFILLFPLFIIFLINKF